MPATFNDLVELMNRLRAPDGCPWDREQTYATLAPMLLEEAYEAFEAVEASGGRPDELRDELGDLLFQIILYAQVAKERGEFEINDITNAIHTKMVRRHPHVFGDVRADDAAQVLRNWESMKAEERRAAGKTENDNSSILDGVPAKAPALMEAHQLSTKAARVGFDWKNVEEIFDKLHEEIEELRQAIKEHANLNDEETHAGVREEIGDLLFAATNIARHMHVEPEAALKLTNRKFRARFRYIEDRLRQQSCAFNETTLGHLEELWQEAKQQS